MRLEHLTEYHNCHAGSEDARFLYGLILFAELLLPDL
jgi:hypothetical protein